MSVIRQVLILAVLAAMLGGGWWIYRNPPGETQPQSARNGNRGPGVPVVVERVPETANMVTVEAVGTAEAVRAITVHPAAAGEVEDIRFAAGATVEAGQTLLRLDSEAERLAVQIAGVELKEAREVLRRYERTPSGAVSEREVDAARTALERARLELARAEVALKDRTVVAPFAGTLGIPQIDPGDRITPETPIATLDDRSALLVDFDVPETHSGSLAVGDRVTLGAWSLPGVDIQGTVAALGSRVDPATRTLQVRARIANPDDRLRPGMSFAIRLSLDAGRYPSVPEVAVLWGRDGAYVWTVGNDGKARKALVRIKRRQSGRVLVEGRLSPGDRVVAVGMQRVRGGLPLAVSERETQPSPGEGMQ